jgi:hypothetical protein
MGRAKDTPISKQVFAKVRAEETGTAGNQDPLRGPPSVTPDDLALPGGLIPSLNEADRVVPTSKFRGGPRSNSPRGDPDFGPDGSLRDKDH